MLRAIQPEDRISHYRVVGPLGAGGMGEVYLAHDQNLERSVAIKVLPVDLVRDEERVRRFVREAKSASSLNHPNIVAIYEIGHEPVHAAGDDKPVSDPIHFISMELVTGETLGEKVRSHNTDIKTLIGYLAQAAEGIAKAHSAGIVHRDLKPSNIMISQDGYAKVLDFGLAKLVEHEAVSGEASATVTVPLQATKSGTLLGTVGYMSPEQIRGSKVDHRSDIFSFGCVLYECVTGQRAFRANTDVETLHQILHQAPTAVEDLNPTAPDALKRLIKRCLVRNPDRRLQSMKDLAIELQEIVDEYENLPPSSGSSSAVGSGGQPTLGGGRRIPPVFLGGVAVVAVVAVVGHFQGWWRPEPRPGPIDRAHVTSIISDIWTCALSPDGKYLAYAAGVRGSQGLWIRQLSTGSSVQLSARVFGETRNISFSPDGSFVYFGTSDDNAYWTVYRIPSLGGSPQRVLVDVDSRVSFSPDGRRGCFRRGKSSESTNQVTDLVIVDLDAGEERILATAPGFTFSSPAWSPSGQWIATIQQTGGADSLIVIDTSTGEYEPLGPVWSEAASCAWLPEDRGVIVTAGETAGENQIWHVTYPGGVARRIPADQDYYWDVAVAADGSALAVSKLAWSANLWSAPLAGKPAPRRLTRNSTMDGQFCVVDDGSIVVAWDGQLRLLDGEGKLVRSITSTPDMRSRSPRRSRSGILFMGIEEAAHIWRVDPAGGAPTQLTSGPTEWVLSVSSDAFLYATRGIEGEVFLATVQEREPRRIPGFWPCAISPDGKSVFTAQHHAPRPLWSIVVRSMDTLEPRLEFDVARPNVLMWMPESDAVAHVITTGESQRIVLQPLDGGEPHSLLEITPPRLDLNYEESYRLSPDGKNLCLMFWEDDVPNLWVVPLEGGEFRPITDFRTGMIFMAEWALDGQSVYFTQGDPEREALLIQDFE